MKPYSRKEFIKLSTTAGAALLLNSCGIGNDKRKQPATLKSDGETTLPSKNISTAAPVEKLDLADKNDPRYDVLRKGFNKRIDKYPLVIAICTSAADVAAAVRYAQDKKLPIAVKSGGHSMEGFSCNDGGMVINLSKMNTVQLLPDNKIAVGPGCILSALYDVILPQGRLLPAGSCGTVGLGGLTLGGGYGIFARKYGLTCDHLLEATMVDGNGNILTTKDNPELLWALRGGGAGNFGVVTEMVYRTHQAPGKLQAHYFKARKLDPDRAASILQTWMELAPELPDTCFSGFVLNGGTLNVLITNYGPDTDQLQALLHKLAAVVDEFKSSKVNDLARMVRNYYGRKDPLYFRNSSAGFFKSFTDISPFIKDILEITIHTPGMIYQVNTMGGNINDPDFEKLSSYPHRAFDFVSELQAYGTSEAQEAKQAEATTQILKITADHGITRQYVNYCSLEFSNWQTAYYGDNYSRLQAIKRKYDPDDRIQHPQSVRG